MTSCRTGRAAPVQQADLSACDQEPIERLGRVQSFAALMAVNAAGTIVHASVNIERYLARPLDEVLGQPLDEALPETIAARVLAAVPEVSEPSFIARLFGLEISETVPSADIAIHRHQGLLILEIQTHDPDDQQDYSSAVQALIDQLSRTRNVQELCDQAAQQLKRLTGFDRVMAYRFEPDGSGSVLAEHKEPDAGSYLGLRFPASDIPRQARALYMKNLLRIISNAASEGVEIRPAPGESSAPLDLTYSTARAVSPVHLEYLRNMGVAGSMSVSIRTQTELWGLFAFHHSSPRTLSYRLRSAVELFGRMFSFLLEQALNREKEEALRKSDLRIDLIEQRLRTDHADRTFATDIAAQAEAQFGACAAFLCEASEPATWKQTPYSEVIAALLERLPALIEDGIFATDELSSVLDLADDQSPEVAGVLAIAISPTAADYLIVFRPEEAMTVVWAGDPSDDQKSASRTQRITPRKSFAAWQETVRGRSKPWLAIDIEAAQALRDAFLKAHADTAAPAALRKPDEHQEVLIAELNHRVRNMLTLIRSLVELSEKEAGSVAEFTEVVGGRIHALARAHDQMMQPGQQMASLTELINTEAAAYISGHDRQLLVQGSDVMLAPSAFTTLSLVVHELMTNAVKYGALTSRHGQIDVELQQADDGSVRMHWRERGGPAIAKSPSRKGFGMTIIERSIPHQLSGEAELEFKTAGLEATFRIPADSVAAPEEKAPRPAAANENRVKTPAKLHGRALLVEDNTLIALSTAGWLEELGADDIVTVGTEEQALDSIRNARPDFALVDTHLGSQTSDAIVKELLTRDVPVVLASGYGASEGVLSRFPGIPILQKPYHRDDIIAALNASSISQKRH